MNSNVRYRVNNSSTMEADNFSPNSQFLFL